MESRALDSADLEVLLPSSIMQQVTVRVPASTSNLGPGFDCLGVALRLYNVVTVRRDELVSSAGKGRNKLVPPSLAEQAARLFFSRSRRKPFWFTCAISDNVPRARGLGSSATVRAGLLLALNQLAGEPLSRQALFELCAEWEGHPDNAAPAFFGGFTVVRQRQVQRFDVSARLRFVLLIPELEIKTPAARRILPARIDLTSAVTNSANACAITAAFASKNYAALRGGFIDELHQPFRQKLIPFLPKVIAAAEEAGALGAFLSGSGSTIAAVTLGSEKKLVRATERAARAIKAHVLVLSADNSGATLLRNQTSNITRRTSPHGSHR
jgi:homoserine kinase